MPAGYRIPPQFHKVDEHVTVSGAFQAGMGDMFDEGKLTTLPPGRFGIIPPGMRHFARSTRPRWFSCTGRDPLGADLRQPSQ